MFHKFDVGESIIYAYYMVCEPVDDKVEQVEKFEQLIEQKDVIEGVKDYYREKFGDKYGYDDLYISVEFYKPSKEFPIGWQPVMAYSMEDYSGITENLLVNVNVPWDAGAVDEHTYDFWRLNPPINNMTHDTYRRETKEDGSMVLIPEVREPKKTPE